MSGGPPVRLSVDLQNEDQAWQLAQFVKRITFGAVRELTDCGQSPQRRDDQTYVMLDGLNAVGRALREKGFAPR
jgi:hypothetical protein